MSQELVKRERSKGKGEGWINEREPFGSSWRGGFPLKTSEQAVELTSPFSLIGAVLSRFESDFTTLWTVVRQAPLLLGISRQEYWKG